MSGSRFVPSSYFNWQGEHHHTHPLFGRLQLAASQTKQQQPIIDSSDIPDPVTQHDGPVTDRRGTKRKSKKAEVQSVEGPYIVRNRAKCPLKRAWWDLRVPKSMSVGLGVQQAGNDGGGSGWKGGAQIVHAVPIVPPPLLPVPYLAGLSLAQLPVLCVLATLERRRPVRLQ